MNHKLHVFSGWEVRTKLAAALAGLICLLFLKQPATIVVLALIILLFIALDCGMSLKKALLQLWHVFPFLLLMLITLSLSGGLPFKKDAVGFACLICLRVIAAVLILVALVGGMSSDGFIRSLAVIPLPPVYLSLMFLVNRYIHMLTRELRLTRQGMRSRMFVPSVRLPALKNTGYAVGGMFIRGYDLSEQVYDAMRSRCYSGVVPFDEAPRTSTLDLLKLFSAILVLAAAIWADRGL